MIKELRKRAKELLESGELEVVIGYAEGSDPARTTPIFCRKPEEVDKLVVDGRCVNSLPLYLNKRHEYPRKGWGKTGIVGKGCDIRAITQLIAENQLQRDEVYIFGFPCDGVVSHPSNWDGKLTAENTASKCSGCDVKIPVDADFYPGGGLPTQDRPGPYRVTSPHVLNLMEMEINDRFAFWSDDFERCFKCYACREVCPHCSCNICITDRTQPNWLDQAAHKKGVFAWHMTRALHLAGRCTGCGECTRACPEGIQVDAFNQRMKQVIQENFDYRSGYSHEEKPSLITFKVDDREDFIR